MELGIIQKHKPAPFSLHFSTNFYWSNFSLLHYSFANVFWEAV